MAQLEASDVHSLERRIARKVGQAIADFGLIEDGDRILVAVSGGKDSWSLLHLLERLRRRAPVRFSLLAVNLHHGFPDYQADRIEDHLRAHGFEFSMQRSEIARAIEAKLAEDDTCCSLCARLRRGRLYDVAPALGCNKIALGHHKDDVIETLLLNLFFTGQIKAMPPLLRSDDGRNTVIRPLVYVDEGDLLRYARGRGFPIVHCACPAVGLLDNLQRRVVKSMLKKLEQTHPGLRSTILRALQNVVPSHLLDRRFMPSTPHKNV